MLYQLSWFAIADGTKHTRGCFRVVLSQHKLVRKQNFRRFDRIELLFWQLTDFAESQTRLDSGRGAMQPDAPLPERQSNPIGEEISMTKFVAVGLTLSACASIALASTGAAQIAQSGYSLPLALAVEAATTAIDACKAKGWPVSAFVVDTSGVVQVHLKGDHSTIHTKDSAFRKAYTVVTMGPIFDFDRTSAFADTINKNPAGANQSLFNLPDIIADAGGVAIKRGNEIVAGLGVGGSPGGDRDEACAQEGVAKIAARVNGNS